jgi:ABC-type multidrug transport system fused ATPase/permease subunit
VVQQSPILFDDTVMNNVRYGDKSATDEEVFEACKAACIHEQIMGFTDGTNFQATGLCAVRSFTLTVAQVTTH